MKGIFKVRYTEGAREDLLRLFEFLIARAQTVDDFAAAQVAIDAISTAVEGHLSRTPFIFRKAAQSPFLRELLISFGSAGYVALYEIEDPSTVTILAVRHQREDDYH